MTLILRHFLLKGLFGFQNGIERSLLLLGLGSLFLGANYERIVRQLGEEDSIGLNLWSLAADEL